MFDFAVDCSYGFNVIIEYRHSMTSYIISLPKPVLERQILKAQINLVGFRFVNPSMCHYMIDLFM